MYCFFSWLQISDQIVAKKSSTIGDSETWFQSQIGTYLNLQFNPYLSYQASIVHSSAFEDPIVVIELGREPEMLCSGEAAARCFKTPNTDKGWEDEDTRLRFVGLAPKWQRMQHSNRSTYIDTKVFLPAWNSVKWLCTLRKGIFSDKRWHLMSSTVQK